VIVTGVGKVAAERVWARGAKKHTTETFRGSGCQVG
jgi:hypothetical protein